jgi:hypothetical protein
MSDEHGEIESLGTARRESGSEGENERLGPHTWAEDLLVLGARALIGLRRAKLSLSERETARILLLEQTSVKLISGAEPGK